MLVYIITALHVLVCLVLILVVLLQSGKGADLAGAFGGGGTQTAFGSRGPASFLSKITTVAAVVFMVTSITLSGMGTKTVSQSVLDGTESTAIPEPTQPETQQHAPAAPTAEEIRRIQQEIEAKQQADPEQEAQPPDSAPAAKKTPDKPPAEKKPLG
jgi:preprotein translocase subunit SecG